MTDEPSSSTEDAKFHCKQIGFGVRLKHCLTSCTYFKTKDGAVCPQFKELLAADPDRVCLQASTYADQLTQVVSAAYPGLSDGDITPAKNSCDSAPVAKTSPPKNEKENAMTENEKADAPATASAPAEAPATPAETKSVEAPTAPAPAEANTPAAAPAKAKRGRRTAETENPMPRGVYDRSKAKAKSTTAAPKAARKPGRKAKAPVAGALRLVETKAGSGKYKALVLKNTDPFAALEELAAIKESGRKIVTVVG